MLDFTDAGEMQLPRQNANKYRHASKCIQLRKLSIK